MIRYHHDGKERFVVNKVVYYGTTLPDIKIETPKTQKEHKRTESNVGGILVTEDFVQTEGHSGTIFENRYEKPVETKECVHGIFWNDSTNNCKTCYWLEKDAEQGGFATTSVKIVTKEEDELKRLNERIAARNKYDPEFDDTDVLAYEQCRIIELTINIREKKVA